jgi:mono/diheme cytochrome c family protein
MTTIAAETVSDKLPERGRAIHSILAFGPDAICSAPRRARCFISPAILIGLLWATSAFAETHASPDQPTIVAPDHAEQFARGLELFDKNVRSILTNKCVKCHGGDKTESEFDLTTREGLVRGGSDGKVITIGDAQKSRLMKLIRHSEEPNMPENGDKLSGDEIDSIGKWIDLGAPYDKSLKDGKADDWTQHKIANEARGFWSFEPLKVVKPPSVRSESWCRTPIDHFVLAKMEEKNVAPNAAGSKRQLIRRAYFDLIGLPPSPEAVKTFVEDTSPDAYERLVDSLLANPHFGERWGQHWLDLARFAESHGYEHDYNRPYAYHYRDFVIRAIDEDLSYNTFIKWQLAGDEYEPDNPLAVMATGFLAAGVHATVITANQAEKERYDELDDMLRTMTTSMLGLTVGCARCHDHKFDPIPQADYYRMLSTFTTTVRSDLEINDPTGYATEKAKYDADQKELESALKKYLQNEQAVCFDEWLQQGAPDPVDKPIDKATIPKPIAALLQKLHDDPGYKFSKEERTTLFAWFQTSIDRQSEKLGEAVKEHANQAFGENHIRALICSENVPALKLHTQGPDFYPQTFFLKRGDINQKISPAEQGFLQVLTGSDVGPDHWQSQPPSNAHTSYRRRALAEWLTDVQNGAGQLLARVIVNRLWQHHLGKGIVSTPSDFGSQGERPTHPELLDWLANSLIQNGWHLKPIHKLIMMSAVYQQDCKIDPEKFAADSENHLVWHRPMQRLEAETIRDAMLSTAGILDTTMYGPGTLDVNQRRRSIYFFVKRSQPIPMMLLFDAPDALEGAGRRQTTVVAPQSLLMLNNPVIRSYAETFARRLQPEIDESPETAVRAAYTTALSRQPTDKELAAATTFLSAQTAAYNASGHTDAATLALADYCQALLGVNEFVFVD